MEEPRGKWLSLEEAAAIVKNGDVVGIGGSTFYRRPMAVIRELVRRRVRNLTLVVLTVGMETDLLVGAGCVEHIRSSYFGSESLGLAPQVRRRAENGDILITQETELTLAKGLRAARDRVGFMPVHGLLDTDLMEIRPDLQLVRCPYTDTSYVAVPPISIDVALLHAPLADEAGNAYLGGHPGLDPALAATAKNCVLSAERIVSSEEVARAGVDLRGDSVSILLEAPYGAHPTSCYPSYSADVAHLLEYTEYCRRGEFSKYLREYVLDSDRLNGYLQKVGAELEKGFSVPEGQMSKLVDMSR